MENDRYNVTIDGVEYVIVPGTFSEGSVRQQAEFPYLGDQDLKSRPDTRAFLHNSWHGGAQWEKPVYGRNNDDTYFESSDLSFTDRAGAAQETSIMLPYDASLESPSTRMAAWGEDSPDGAVISRWHTGSTWKWYEWRASSDDWFQTGVGANTYTESQTNYLVAISAGSDGRVYALHQDGGLHWHDPTAHTDGDIATVSVAMYNGASMWVDRDYVWIYNGDQLYRYAIAGAYAEESMADDDWGIDAFSRSASFSGKPIIPEWSCTRAITTSEGIFYVKNVFEGGLVVSKVYRVDRDASGEYILTPIGTLPKGMVAINITEHLGSILIATVSNFFSAVNNADDQRVTFYHVTDRNIGAVGSPLGGTNIDETPVWFLGTVDEQLFFGGRRSIWQYDARVGAFHEFKEQTGTKYTDHGGGWFQMAAVDSTTGPGLLFLHCSQDGTGATPYELLLVTDRRVTTDPDNAFVTSNWFDFDLPMEEKSIYELYYDMSNLRDDSTIVIAVSVDGGAFTTVATLTGGVSADTARIPITPIRGFKFQYRATFSTDTDTTSSEPSRLLAVGFSAHGGKMVDVIQFTIDGNETCNIENNVQVPYDVYTNLKTLRQDETEFSVVHTMADLEADVTVTDTYLVASVLAKKEKAYEGQYEVVLMGINN